MLAAGAVLSPPPAAEVVGEPDLSAWIRAPAAARSVADHVDGGEGTPAAPWTGWEDVFDAVPAAGLRIDFRPGHYEQRVPVALPVDLDGWLEILGHGAEIHLTATAPRFLDVGRTADGQTLRRVHLEGFTIDAHAVGGRHHVILGIFQGGDTTSGRCLDVDGIVIREIATRNVPTYPDPDKHHRLNLWLGSIDPGPGRPPCPQGEASIRNVLVEDLDLAGGNMGVVIFGSGAGVARVWLDEIHVHHVHHDLLVPPRKGYYSSNVHLGSRGYGGRAHVSNVVGRNSADVGIEVNGFQDAVVEENLLENAFFAGILVRNYTDRVDPGRQRIRVRENTVVYTSDTGGRRTKRGISVSESGPFPLGSVRIDSYDYYTRETEWNGEGSCLHVLMRNEAPRTIVGSRIRCSFHELADHKDARLRPVWVDSTTPLSLELDDLEIDLRGAYHGRGEGTVEAVRIEGPVAARLQRIECGFRIDAPPSLERRCIERVE